MITITNGYPGGGMARLIPSGGLVPPDLVHGMHDPHSVYPGLSAYEAARVRAVREAVRVWLDQEKAMNAAFPPIKRGMADV